MDDTIEEKLQKRPRSPKNKVSDFPEKQSDFLKANGANNRNSSQHENGTNHHVNSAANGYSNHAFTDPEEQKFGRMTSQMSVKPGTSDKETV